MNKCVPQFVYGFCLCLKWLLFNLCKCYQFWKVFSLLLICVIYFIWSSYLLYCFSFVIWNFPICCIGFSIVHMIFSTVYKVIWKCYMVAQLFRLLSLCCVCFYQFFVLIRSEVFIWFSNVVVNFDMVFAICIFLVMMTMYYHLFVLFSVFWISL